MPERQNIKTLGPSSQGRTVLLRIFNIQMKKVILRLLREAGWRPIDVPRAMMEIPYGCDPCAAIVDLPLDDEETAWLADYEFPIIRLGILPHHLDRRFPAVLFDHADAGRLAAKHFVERGYRRVGFIAMPWDHVNVNYEAFRDNIKVAGGVCELMSLNPRSSEEAFSERYRKWYRRLEAWLVDQVKPTAVYTYDQVASMVCMICASRGLSIPDDVAVLAFDNAMLSNQADLVELSAIDLGYEAFGERTVSLLEQITNGEPAPSEPILVPSAGVIERQSTNALAVPDPIVAQALRYIWDNLELQVSVTHISREVGVSRSTLERKFRQCLGRSVNAERHRKRLSRCAELLLSTDLTIADIGQFVGIPNNSYLHRSFRATYGMTPRAYRLHGKA